MDKQINKFTVLVLLFSMLLILSACNKDNTSQKANRNILETSADNIFFTEAKFEDYLIAISRSHVTGAGRKKLHNEWIKKQLFTHAASRRGLDKDPIIIAKIENYRRELFSQIYVNKRLKKRFSDDKLKRQYESKIEDFTIKEIHIAHILISSNSVSDVEAKGAKQHAIEIMTKIRAGELFDKVATRMSSDASTSSRGGDLGWMPLKLAVKLFGDEIIAMKKGKLIGPIQTNQGWHIVSILDSVKDRVQSFNEVKRQLIERNRAGFVKTLESELRERYKLHLLTPTDDPMEGS